MIVLDVMFEFLPPSISLLENVGSSEICVNIMSGQLARNITLNIISEEDADQRTLDGNIFNLYIFYLELQIKIAKF